jgi:ATP-binding protein involved in chromosome partitioning
MAQKIPVSGAVLVSTPQDLALLDVRRAAQMFQKVNVPVLGVIENMSGHTCSQCGHVDPIFGAGGAATFAAQHELPLLGQLPLAIEIRECADNGKPIVIAKPDSLITNRYLEIAKAITLRLSLQKRSYAHIIPKVVVE